MIANQIGRYEIKGDLPAGGMSEVLHAYDPRLGRDVVIKLLPAAADNTLTRWFACEGQVLATLEGAPIVSVYDQGHYEGRPYLVMRYMCGGTLLDKIDGAALPLYAVQPIMARIVEALTAAHANGIVHRDLKPSNILFDEQDRAYLADFGIAHLEAADLVQTSFGTPGTPGTPAYMAPEQWRREPPTARTDIYQLGVLLFRALSGELPYRADDRDGYRGLHLNAPIPTLSRAAPQSPPAVDTVLQKAMAKAPGDRYDSIVQFAEAFDRAIAGHVVEGLVPANTGAIDNQRGRGRSGPQVVTVGGVESARLRTWAWIWAATSTIAWSGATLVAAVVMYIAAARAPAVGETLLGEVANIAPVAYVSLVVATLLIVALGVLLGGAVSGVIAGAGTQLVFGRSPTTPSKAAAWSTGWTYAALTVFGLGIGLSGITGALRAIGPNNEPLSDGYFVTTLLLGALIPAVLAALHLVRRQRRAGATVSVGQWAGLALIWSVAASIVWISGVFALVVCSFIWLAGALVAML